MTVDLLPATGQGTGPVPAGAGRRLRTLVRRDLGMWLLLALALLFVATAVFPEWFSGYTPTERAGDAMQPPFSSYLLGTDELGRDVFSRIVHGSRVSLTVSFCAVLLGALVGVPLGVVSGYVGGIVDTLVMRLTDVLLSFPALILALVIAFVLNPGIISVVIAIGVVAVPEFTRLARGLSLEVREREYVLAAASMGARPAAVMVTHVWRNIRRNIVVFAMLKMAQAMLIEADLSFIGVGVPPPQPSWGRMAAEGFGQLTSHPVLSLAPALAVVVSVFLLRLLGERWQSGRSR